MFNNINSNNQMFAKYIQANPQYKELKYEELLKQMLSDGAITQEEYNKIKNGDTFKFSYKETNFDDINGLWGANFSAGKSSRYPQNFVEKIKYYHPVFSDLELNNKGKIDDNQFDYENIKAKYGEKNYALIGTNIDNSITVADKNTKQPLLSYFKDEQFKTMILTKYDPDGKPLQSIMIKTDGTLEGVTDFKSDGSEKYYRFIDGNPNKYSQIIEKYPDGTRITTGFDRHGNKEFSDTWKMGGNSPERAEYYTDGKLYKVTENKNNTTTARNILVEDLIKDMGIPNKKGFLTKSSPSLKDDILKRIKQENAYEIFETYKKETGVDLITAVKNNTSLNSKTKETLVLHLEKQFVDGAFYEESSKFLGELLFDDINGLGSGNLKEHVKMIKKNHLKYILKIYADKSHEQYMNVKNKISNISKYLPFSISYETENKLADFFAPYEGLLSAIDGEKGLSKKEREELISQIILISMEDLSDDMKAEVKKDISEHPQDYNKVYVDVLRTLNKSSGDFRNPNKQDGISLPDGKFDGTVKQGNTGDCWLLAAVDSLIAKPEGKKAVESLIKYDKNTGDAVVTLRGMKKKYTITAQEIKAASNLSSGDGDARIIELAMDKFIKEQSYKSKDPSIIIDEDFHHINGVDINCNWPRFLYYSLLGFDNYDYESDKIDPAKEDFSNPQKAYSFALTESSPMGIYAKDSNNGKITIVDRHAYAIVGSDEKNVYIVNPWDSSETLTMTREDFVKLNIKIDACNIPAT